MIFLIFLIIVFIQSLKSSFSFHVQLSMIYCPFRALTVFAVTRRVAAGWYVFPFQGERITVIIDRCPQTENAPEKV
ncbi:MAG: hypothetical protein LBG58_05880 [Planctomycetaceae bacterium]|jgi:hypothetical protein|nr:hypothetical protein [Planctomycetaceae bacterium]